MSSTKVPQHLLAGLRCVFTANVIYGIVELAHIGKQRPWRKEPQWMTPLLVAPVIIKR